jgi:1,4-alpha-glucan branching enzyme
MASKKSSPKKVTFQISAPDARDVRLAGDFNSWNPSNTTLRKAKDGVWKRDLSLKPGRYEYKYVVDGQWRRDPINNLFTVNAYGTENSVIEL